MAEKRTFAVVLEPEDEGGFTVRVPDLLNRTTARTKREALAMAEEENRL